MLKLFELLRVFHLYHKISQTYMKSTISVYFGLHLILFMPVETYFMSEEYLIIFFFSNHDTGDTNSLDVKKKNCESCQKQGHQNNFHRAPYRRQKEAFQHFA